MSLEKQIEEISRQKEEISRDMEERFNRIGNSPSGKEELLKQEIHFLKKDKEALDKLEEDLNRIEQKIFEKK